MNLQISPWQAIWPRMVLTAGLTGTVCEAQQALWDQVNFRSLQP